MDSLIDLLAGFVMNLIAAVVIVRFVYCRARPNKDYVFTFLAFNTIVYFVMTFMGSAELSVGVGFGLFAIFSLLRYRTATMSTRDMTYLFVLIALPVMNALLMRSANWLMLVVVNVVMTLVLFVLEQGWGFRYESVTRVKYERIDLVRPENHALLIHDLEQRTGLKIKRVEIGRYNFLTDTAQLRLYCEEP